MSATDPAKNAGNQIFGVMKIADIARRPPVPGANDNAAAVAVLLGLANDLAPSTAAIDTGAAGLHRLRGNDARGNGRLSATTPR